MSRGLVVGIDASNLRAGGGRTHLIELLRATGPHLEGFRRVIAWGGTETINRLPDEPWLERVSVPALDSNLASRLAWQTYNLPRLLADGTILFAPGGRIPRTRSPTVVMCRNMLPFERRERARFPLARRLRLEMLRLAQMRAFERASGVIFLTGYAQREVGAQLRRAPRRTAVIPHGIGERFRRPPRRCRRLDELSESQPLRILYVSYLAPYKHQDSVARAVARLRKRFPVRLDLVGGADTPADAAALARVRQELDPRSIWLHHRGSVPQDELPEIYARAECFVFASSCENMPNVLLEAMASGLPIACSKLGPMPEVLGEAGVFFAPEDAESITAAIESLVRDPLRAFDLATRAYARAAQFTWTQCAARTFRMLRSVGSEARQ